MLSTTGSSARRVTVGSMGLSKPDFDTVYESMVEYVWNAVCRMGVPRSDADDVVQDVFVIVHRRLREFEGRAQLKSWVFKILVHLVQHCIAPHIGMLKIHVFP